MPGIILPSRVALDRVVADRDAALPPTTQANIPFIYAWSYEGGGSQRGTATV